jgi:hypothetical protein
VIPSKATNAGYTASDSRSEAPVHQATRQTHLLLIAFAVFGLYLLSSFVLYARGGFTHFAADTWFYMELSKGNIFERLADSYHLDRIFRFHPTTVVVAAGWMKITEPLTPWIAPVHLLKAMFALVGALGVWAAMRALSAVVPRRDAVLWGIVYATSLTVWYFSSIEESKIVSATLAALYIATYLHLRTKWTLHGAALLSAILLAACLNEIVAGFLLIIPIVDTLVARGWDLRYGRWIALHALAGPIALALLEGIMRGRSGAAGAHPEGANHFSMLIWYVSQNDYSMATLYEFLANWLFFNFAAPTPDTPHPLPLWPEHKALFEPALGNYLASPVSAGIVVIFAVMLLASVLPRYRSEGSSLSASILLALSAYTLLRGLFFFVFLPSECILYASSVTLAHLLIVAIPFAASSFPAKPALLAGLGGLLFITNGAFVIGP